ncbi:MAG: N-acetyltransferase family protein [Bacteroidales bacterium]|nr:N-acetyltransferase family protein [Bacteroidales bacterium]
MEKFEFVKMDQDHGKEIMEIFNYYIETTTAAYPQHPLPEAFFGKILEVTAEYPAFTILSDKKVVGFCFLKPHNPLPTFRRSAEITYFIKKEYTGKGLGKMALEILEQEAPKTGIKNILASISGDNDGSINFHRKNGFVECGRFKDAGEKFGKTFDVVWMIKKV